MPNICRNLLSLIAPPADVERFIAKAGPPEEPFQFPRLVPLPAGKEDDLEAQRETWGIKWGEMGAARMERVAAHVVQYAYDTPWAPGEAFLDMLGWEWTRGTSAALLVASWCEPGWPYRGRIVCSTGGRRSSWLDHGAPLELSYGYCDEASRDDKVRRWAMGFWEQHGEAVAELAEIWLRAPANALTVKAS